MRNNVDASVNLETPEKIDMHIIIANPVVPNFEVQMSSNIKLKEKINSVGSTPGDKPYIAA